MSQEQGPLALGAFRGSQYTGLAFSTVLNDDGARIPTGGRDCLMNNVFIERLWLSLKYECALLNAIETGNEAQAGIGHWIGCYNAGRPHTALVGKTSVEPCAIENISEKLAA